jgi:hypothetical protein
MQRTVLTAKIESTYNTDPTPAGTDALLVENLQVAWPTDVLDRPGLSSSMSPFAHVHGRKHAVITFDVEYKGSGSLGVAADWGPMLRACGFGETVDSGVSVTYAPISTAFESITLWVYRDGVAYKVTGCRGTVSFSWPAGQIAKMSFTMTGHTSDALDLSLVSETLDTTIPVSVVNSSFTMNSYAGVISALNLDIANAITLPDSVNGADGYGEVQIIDRNPQGSMDPDVVLVATHDFWSEWEDDTQMALSIVVGATATNILTFTAPKCVFRELSENDKNGVYGYSLPFLAARNTGDDEVSLAMT